MGKWKWEEMKAKPVESKSFSSPRRDRLCELIAAAWGKFMKIIGPTLIRARHRRLYGLRGAINRFSSPRCRVISPMSAICSVRTTPSVPPFIGSCPYFRALWAFVCPKRTPALHTVSNQGASRNFPIWLAKQLPVIRYHSHYKGTYSIIRGKTQQVSKTCRVR